MIDGLRATNEAISMQPDPVEEVKVGATPDQESPSEQKVIQSTNQIVKTSVVS